MAYRYNPITGQLDNNIQVTQGRVDLGIDDVSNAVINAPESLYLNIDSANDSSNELFIIATNRDGSTGGTELLAIDENGNVGIGTTAPDAVLDIVRENAGSNEDLVLRNNSTDTSTKARLILASTTGNPTDDVVNGRTIISNIRQSDSSGDLKITLAGGGSTDRDAVYLDGSNGNVGLGTTSPNAKLEIGGIAASGQTEAFTIDRSDGVQLFSIEYDHANNAVNLSGNTKDFVFKNSTSSTETMRVDRDGNVGIGTTSPDDVLDVRSGAAGFSQFVHASGQGGIRIAGTGTSSNANLVFSNNHNNTLSDEYTIQMDGSTDSLAFLRGGTSASETARFDSSGRLLVGHSSSADQNAKIQASTTGREILEGFNYADDEFGARLRLAKSRNASIGSQTIVQDDDELGLIAFSGSDGSVYRNAALIRGYVDGTPGAGDMPGRLVFSTSADGSASPTERMRIGSTGAFTSFTNGSFHGFKTNATGAASEFLLFQNNASSLTTGTTVARVRADGDLENTNNSYTGISDAKLKENIVDASSQWEDIKALRVRKYNFKQDTGFGTHTQLGIIAQETETVSPGLVKEAPDLDNEGNDLGTTTKSVNYSVLYMKAVKALQEAMDRIETLEAKVAALEAG